MASSENLWDKFLTYDNFLLAWQRTVNVTSRMIIDELGFQIFAFNLEANLKDLIRQVQAEDFPYTPLADHKVYVPKPSTTLRTMSLMTVPDVIVYQALVNVIADESHQYLVTHQNQHIFGNIYAGSGKRWMLRPWKQQYKNFVNSVERLYRKGNSWIASTDIVSFYDTIDHERLIQILRKYCRCKRDSKFENLLRECLSKWSAHTANVKMSRGIPQGSNASDFLANLFLYELDKIMIGQGYNYVRYVDDIRILGHDKQTVQQGLIFFDLELKRAGLVAQVTKTSIHEIEDINKEITHLRFIITDPTGTGEYTLIKEPTISQSEQAELAANYVKKTNLDSLNEETKVSDIYTDLDEDSDDDFEEEGERYSSNKNLNTDITENEKLQQQLREIFLEAYSLLDTLDKSKEAESNITFCLYRLEPYEPIRDKIVDLLDRLPWRSEAICYYLGRFKNDSFIVEELQNYINKHKVYSWHRANSLWSLYQISGAKNTAFICREWLADTRLDWYARMIAARILGKLPGQHSYFMECLQQEQHNSKDDSESSSLLRQELAYSAFQRIKSYNKLLALFRLICTDKSPIMHRLAIYLLQMNKCRVTWDDLKPYHQEMSKLSDLVKSVGLSSDAPKICFIYQTLSTIYNVSFSYSNLCPFYSVHYERAVEQLRESVSSYHKSPNAYIRTFHQFAHLTLIAFYEYTFPSESGLHDGYASLTDRKVFTSSLPNGCETWKELGSMRNRVDHPVDKKTKSHSKKITIEETEFFCKKLNVALQEIFNFWLNSSPTSAPTISIRVSTT
ncbi:reverse transcriptase domain-containing protein [Nostoc sp.]|uniref:reverse transcriptase domain-containing protein n=1 Tax=Nostoc sp. TaxID=1180 RepID=UPI002FF919FD